MLKVSSQYGGGLRLLFYLFPLLAFTSSIPVPSITHLVQEAESIIFFPFSLPSTTTFLYLPPSHLSFSISFFPQTCWCLSPPCPVRRSLSQSSATSCTASPSPPSPRTVRALLPRPTSSRSIGTGAGGSVRRRRAKSPPHPTTTLASLLIPQPYPPPSYSFS